MQNRLLLYTLLCSLKKKKKISLSAAHQNHLGSFEKNSSIWAPPVTNEVRTTVSALMITRRHFTSRLSMYSSCDLRSEMNFQELHIQTMLEHWKHTATWLLHLEHNSKQAVKHTKGYGNHNQGATILCLFLLATCLGCYQCLKGLLNTQVPCLTYS